jgi:hypothetical protein
MLGYGKEKNRLGSIPAGEDLEAILIANLKSVLKLTRTNSESSSLRSPRVAILRAESTSFAPRWFRLHHPLHRRVLPVLHLDPMLRPAASIGPVAMLRHQTFEPHVARCAKEIRADLAALERADEDALGPARQQAFEVGLAQVERQRRPRRGCRRHRTGLRRCVCPSAAR